MTSTNNSVAVQNSSYLQSLVDYVLDVKPFRTKLAASGAVSEEYVFSDNMSVKFDIKENIRAYLGADLAPFSPEAYSRAPQMQRSRSWVTNYVSDAIRRTWLVPNISYPKLAGHSSLSTFVEGQHNYFGIPGLSTGVFDQKRWDNVGPAEVRKNGQIQQDGVDYFLSHGVFSFDAVGVVNGVPSWIQHYLNNSIPTIQDVLGEMATDDILNTDNVINSIPPGSLAAYAAFEPSAGALLYQNVYRLGGSLSNIYGETYEEFTAVCISTNPATLEIRSPNEEGVLGTVQLGETFTLYDGDGLIRIRFTFEEELNQPLETAEVGDFYEIVPFHKVTVSPTAPEETWSLIKSNPIGVVSTPVWSPNPTLDRAIDPALTVHARSIENTPKSNWSIIFSSNGNYTLTAVDTDTNLPLAGYPITKSLIDGCSHADGMIAFTLHPVDEGFTAGDTFTWSISEKKGHYKVFGSVSGWTTDLYTGRDAEVGKFFWNGKIGFKIPKLELFAEVYNSTIATSPSGDFQSWKTTISNSQVLRDVSYRDGLFLTTGDNQIVGASTNGSKWTSDIASIFTPDANQILIVHGENGTIGRSTDGVVWYSQNTGVNVVLRASTMIPNFLASEGSSINDLNCFIVVGDAGTILTSVDGLSWAIQNSGTTESLYQITWSNDSIIAVGTNGTILRSEDRITWTPVNTSGNSSDLRAVHYRAPDATYPQGVFIAMGTNATVLRSTDGGFTWFDLNAFPGSTAEFTSIAYGNGTYVAVGPSGTVAQSDDGFVWTSYSGKIFNSVAFGYDEQGNGIFVAVGGSTNDIPQFTPSSTRPSVSVMAEPSTYIITFTEASDSANGIPGRATVFNNIRNYGPNLVTGQEWSDDWISFKLDTIAGLYDYSVGDVIYVHVAPTLPFPSDIEQFATYMGYDAARYDTIGYDSGLDNRNARRPSFYNSDLYPLYHSHGAVIFPDTQTGDGLEIDKAAKDLIYLKVEGATAAHPELGAVNDWIPLYFKYFDRREALTDPYSEAYAHFSDLSLVMYAYSAATGQPVMRIHGARYEKTNRLSRCIVVIDRDFFNEYLPAQTKYTIATFPDNNYGQTIRVKISEALKVYARIKIDLNDIMMVSFEEQEIISLEPTSIFFGEGPITGYWRWEDEEGYPPSSPPVDGVGGWRFITPFNSPEDQAWLYPFSISVTEGGAVIADPYDMNPYDTFLYDYTGVVPIWQIYKRDTSVPEESGSPDVAVSRITDGLQFSIVNTATFSTTTVLTYDFDVLQPIAETIPSLTTGMVITSAQQADEFKITLVNAPSMPANLIFAPNDNLGALVSVPAEFTAYEMLDSGGSPIIATDPNSVTFSLPPGVTYPFRLWIV